MTTLRRELKAKFEEVLKDGELAEKLVDIALELRCFREETLEEKVDWEQADPAWAILAGKPITQGYVNKQKDIYEFETMIDAQLARLKLNWNGFRDPEKDAFRRFLKTERKRGRELETWVNWWMSDEWRVAHPIWKLDAIKAQWLKAFAEEKKLREVQTDENGIPKSY